MFCNQCQETAKNQGCTIQGVCGKKEQTANFQDLLIFCVKGLSILTDIKAKKGFSIRKEGIFIAEAMFMTITNANFDNSKFIKKIKDAVKMRDELKQELSLDSKEYPLLNDDSVVWGFETEQDMLDKYTTIGILATKNEDIRSLRQLLTYGIKGMSAYKEHALNLDFIDESIFAFMAEALAATRNDELSIEDLIALNLKCGETGVKVMALLDKANTDTFGHPEPTKVNIGVGDKPGILISGHDLRDLKELLEQSKDQGIDIYTHSEMLPANSYPELKKYPHLKGNYGGSWWHQLTEFDKFNGPILLTTNCLVPPKDSYKNRLFTSGPTGFEGVTHIPDREPGKSKDFSAIIEMAKKCSPPTKLEEGTVNGGFARNTVMSVADKVIDAVKSGAIKRFIVMAGCDGRHKQRSYYSEVAQNLPKDTIILTAGCAKYRYNKLELGEIGGIPRVLDAGQCNDCYSLAYIALQLKEAFGLDDINKLPISYDVAWYEQKAVLVLLALLSLGVKGIRLGPTLPGFASPAVVDVLVKNFDLKPISTPDEDIELMMQGK